MIQVPPRLVTEIIPTSLLGKNPREINGRAADGWTAGQPV
jgi:hypothetical protein